MQDWIAVVGAKTAYIERGSPLGNGYIKSFNASLRDELLNGENTLREAQIVIESCDATTTRSGPTPQSDTNHQHAFAAWPAALRRLAPSATLAQRPTLN